MLQQCAKFSEYLKSVCNQVRWKKSHYAIYKELSNHLEDQKSSFIKSGMLEMEAERKAIEEMGNPIEIGTALNEVYRPRVEWKFPLLVIIWLALGVSMQALFSTSTSVIQTVLHSSIGVVLGGCAFVVGFSFNMQHLRKYATSIYLFVTSLFALLLLLLPHITGRIDGKIPYISYLFLLFPLLSSMLIYHMRDRKLLGIFLCELSILIPSFLGMFVSSISGIFITAISGVVTLTYAILTNWFKTSKTTGLALLYAPFTLITGLLFLLAWKQSPHRINAIFVPSSDPLGSGYLGISIKKILSSANFIGGGIDANKLPPIPNERYQYIIALLINKIGWIPIIVGIFLFFMLLIRGISICKKQTNFFGRFISLSITIVLGLQFICYFVNNMGITLFSEFPFPFLSGTLSISANLFLIGILLSLHRNDILFTDEHKENENHMLFEYTNGRLILYLK